MYFQIEITRLKWDQSARLSPFFSTHVQLSGTTNKLVAKLDLIGVKLCQVNKTENTRAGKLKGVCNGVTTRRTTESKLRKEGRGHGCFTKHVLYLQPLCELNKNRWVLYYVYFTKECYSVSLCWLIKWVFPIFQNSKWYKLIRFFLKQLSKDLKRKINLWLKCFSSKEQMTGFPWYFNINKD